MVCIYCGKRTNVVNSRRQIRSNQVWRRRACSECGSVFTTLETVDLGSAVMVQDEHSGGLEPLGRDKLFVSLYDSCRHRQNAVQDAAALTSTILGQLRRKTRDGVIGKAEVQNIAHTALRRFDKAAAVHYEAYHRHA